MGARTRASLGIGVIGGSKDYTGAPYYAGMAALRTGAELVYLFTERGAATAIKTYR
jgi:ATP-dependent NAD(P)H-hydrate dehydratase